MDKNLSKEILLNKLERDLFLIQKANEVKVGDIIKISYKIFEGEKERIQFYEGVVIAKKSTGLHKSITIRRKVLGIGVEQVFILNSPKIIMVKKKDALKIRRAKLYYLRKQKKGKKF